MELKQRLELRKLMVPELTQSLRILSMPLLDLMAFLEQEIEGNPMLEEVSASVSIQSRSLYFNISFNIISYKPRGSILRFYVTPLQSLLGLGS